SGSNPFDDKMKKIVIEHFKIAVAFASVNAKSSTYNIIKHIYYNLHEQNETQISLVLDLFSEKCILY
ncbi:MAG: hypothetical protein K2I73_03740, partial [Eubacterium sp.]|nr:hypothetical protein [Eubacterium sp.]